MTIKYYDKVLNGITTVDIDEDIVIVETSLPPEVYSDILYCALLPLNIPTYLKVGGTYYRLNDHNIDFNNNEFIITYNGVDGL